MSITSSPVIELTNSSQSDALKLKSPFLHIINLCGEIFTSSDGTTWIYRTSLIANNLMGVT